MVNNYKAAKILLAAKTVKKMPTELHSQEETTTLQTSNCYSSYHYFRSSSLQSYCSSDNTDEEQETNSQEIPLCHNCFSTALQPLTARCGLK